MIINDPRRTKAYRKARDQFIARAAAINAPCWLAPLGHCVLNGAPIDYTPKRRSPRSAELHHKRPVSTHPWLGLAESNWAVGHAQCNQVLGNRSPLLRLMVGRGHQPGQQFKTPHKWVKPTW